MENPHSNCHMICVFLMFIVSTNRGGCSTNLVSGCKTDERNALNKFNHSLANNFIIPAWEEEEKDCCRWGGVTCDNSTGHVVELDLDGNFTNAEFSLKYLLELKHLEYLDLSGSDFNSNPIPKVIGSMKQLRYLNLSDTGFYGLVPHELGNLTNLLVLDLYNNVFFVDNLNWVSSLRQLQYLDMSGGNLSKAHDWEESLIGKLPSLRLLYLRDCGLPATLTATKTPLKNSSLVSLIHDLDLSVNMLEGTFPTFIQNLTFLENLDLSQNKFRAKIPYGLGQLQGLHHLDLSMNNFNDIEGGLWNILRNLCKLRTLNIRLNSLKGNLFEPRENLSRCLHHDLETLTLDNNRISGSIPAWLGETLSNLNYLDLSHNNISGPISASLGMLSSLQNLALSYNQLRGTVLTQAHFAKLKSLTLLFMSDTFLELRLPINWTPPFHLDTLDARACKINGSFPQWLQTQKELEYLDLSNASISGKIPKWFHNMPNLTEVHLSHNQITGPPVFPKNFNIFNLSNNLLHGPILADDKNTDTYDSADSVDLSDNFISGPIPKLLHHYMPNLESLILSHNQINGSIPISLCLVPGLQILDLQSNMLTGTIPNCWVNSIALNVIRLSSNRLSGNIPCFTGGDYGVRILQLDDNNLQGQIPSCFSDLTNLVVLDLGGNKLSGHIPRWINGQNFGTLNILRLRGNNFDHVIPSELCSLSRLKLLDLGHNYFNGTVPLCFSNLTAMNSPFEPFDYGGEGEISAVIDGIERKYTNTLRYLVNIDLSCNKLVGGIPIGITNLSYLLALNLSYNQLTGQIPDNIGGLKSLESLDLSCNHLSGRLPQSFSELTSLSSLNLSYNNLQGQIPSCTPLQSRDHYAYIGNPGLRGCPLPKNCAWYSPPPPLVIVGSRGDDDEQDKHEQMWFYLVIMLGVATGFWGVIGTLLLKKSWRHAFSCAVDDATDWVHVRLIVKARAIKRLWKSNEP